MGDSDVDLIDDPFDRHSTTDYFTFVKGNLVRWSKKQNVVARCNTETEYSAMT